VASQLCCDMSVLIDTPVRMMYTLFESDCFHPSPHRRDCGSKVLRGLLDTLPDNKIVEDIHNALRRDSRANANMVQRTAHVQQIICQSGVLESRQVDHPSRVCKEMFVQHFRATSGRACGQRHRGWKHQLPKAWTKIMGRRTWKAISEETLKTAMAAWEWLQNGFRPEALAAPQGTEKLELALLSCTLEQDMLLQHVPTGSVQVCLGNAKWGGLTWPVQQVAAAAPGLGESYKLSEQGPVRFMHVTDLSHWHVVPYEPARVAVGIVLRRTGLPQSLLRARLAAPRTLTYEDLCLIARVAGAEGVHNKSRKQLLEALAASEGDDAFVQQVLEQDARPSRKAAAKLADDVVCEAAYEAMDQDDRNDFAEIGESVRRGRARRRVHAWATRAHRNRWGCLSMFYLLEGSTLPLTDFGGQPRPFPELFGEGAHSEGVLSFWCVHVVPQGCPRVWDGALGFALIPRGRPY